MAGFISEEFSDRSGSVRSVERAAAIMAILAEQRNPLGVSEIASRMKLHPATVHRLLATLTRLGWLDQELDGSRYKLGNYFTGIGAATVASSALVQHGRDFLRRLSDATGYSAYISVLIGRRVTYLARVPGRLGPGKFSDFEAGSISHPAHTMADGKVLLAFLPAPEREQLFENETLRSYSPNTIIEMPALMRELDTIRAQGYAIDRGERFHFHQGVAVPIRDSRDAVSAAMLCWGPMEVTPELETSLSQEMTLLSEELSHRLGMIDD
jgi:IclR family acetate operon transcriptional repressor